LTVLEKKGRNYSREDTNLGNTVHTKPSRTFVESKICSMLNWAIIIIFY
jgi:hypothetical protein